MASAFSQISLIKSKKCSAVAWGWPSARANYSRFWVIFPLFFPLNEIFPYHRGGFRATFGGPSEARLTAKHSTKHPTKPNKLQKQKLPYKGRRPQIFPIFGKNFIRNNWELGANWIGWLVDAKLPRLVEMVGSS